MQQVELVNQIAKTNEGGFWASLVNEEHGCQVAHALDIADVRSEVVESTQDIFQGGAQTMDLFEE